MKQLIALVLVTGMITGCASQQLYNIPSQKTKADFYQVRDECSRSSGYSQESSLSGPIIIVFPVAFVLGSIGLKYQSEFEKCLAANNYKCISGCTNDEHAEEGYQANLSSEKVMLRQVPNSL